MFVCKGSTRVGSSENSRSRVTERATPQETPREPHSRCPLRSCCLGQARNVLQVSIGLLRVLLTAIVAIPYQLSHAVSQHPQSSPSTKDTPVTTYHDVT